MSAPDLYRLRAMPLDRKTLYPLASFGREGRGPWIDVDAAPGKALDARVRLNRTALLDAAWC